MSEYYRWYNAEECIPKQDGIYEVVYKGNILETYKAKFIEGYWEIVLPLKIKWWRPEIKKHPMDNAIKNAQGYDYDIAVYLKNKFPDDVIE